jgi:hypothetical protein
MAKRNLPDTLLLQVEIPDWQSAMTEKEAEGMMRRIMAELCHPQFDKCAGEIIVTSNLPTKRTKTLGGTAYNRCYEAEAARNSPQPVKK